MTEERTDAMLGHPPNERFEASPPTAKPPAANSTESKWPSRLLLVAKLAVTGLILFWLSTKVDIGAVVASFAKLSPTLLVPTSIAFLIIPVLGGLRWWAILRGMGSGDGRLAPLVTFFSVGTMLGQFLPAAVGDGMRIFLTARRGYGLQAAFNSVFLERVLMVLVLLVMVMATSGLLADRVGQTGSAWAATALLLGGVGGLGSLTMADRITGRLGEWRLVRSLARLSADTRRLFSSRWLPYALVLCLLGNLNFVLAASLLARALGLPVTFTDLLAFIPLVTAAAALPISVGGWGMREGILVVLLGHIGVAASNALSLSVMFGLGSMVSGLPGFVVWWLGSRGALDLAKARQAIAINKI